MKDLRSYKATAVHRLTNREGVASLAVWVTDVLEAIPCRVKGGLQLFQVDPLRSTRATLHLAGRSEITQH